MTTAKERIATDNHESELQKALDLSFVCDDCAMLRFAKADADLCCEACEERIEKAGVL